MPEDAGLPFMLVGGSLTGLAAGAVLGAVTWFALRGLEPIEPAA